MLTENNLKKKQKNSTKEVWPNGILKKTTKFNQEKLGRMEEQDNHKPKNRKSKNPK